VGIRRVLHILRVVHVASRARFVGLVEVLLRFSDRLLQKSMGDLGLWNAKVSSVKLTEKKMPIESRAKIRQLEVPLLIRGKRALTQTCSVSTS